MSRGSSCPATACSAMCWWSTGIDGMNAPTIAATCGAQIPQALTTCSVSIRPPLGQHRPHRPPVIELDARHARVLQYHRPQLAGGVGQRVRGRVRVDAAVLLDPDRAVQVVPAGLWHQLQRLVRRQHVHVEPDAAGPARAPLQLHQALGAGRDPEAAEPVEHPQPLVQLDAVAAEPHHRRRGVELGHQAGRVAGRTAGQLSLLDQHHVPPARQRQVVGDAASGDTAADDDDLRAVGETGLYHVFGTDYSGRHAGRQSHRRADRRRPRAARRACRHRARGRPHEHQLQGRDRPGHLRRADLGQGLRPARDRPRERVPEHGRRRRGGRRPGRHRLHPGALADGAGVHRGPDAERRGPAPRGQDRDGGARLPATARSRPLPR